MIRHNLYKDYKRGLSGELGQQFDQLENLILRETFWEEMAEFTSILLPAVVALRLMDQSTVRCKDVVRIWESLGDRLGIVLHDSKLSLERRKLVFSSFVKAWGSAHRPIFDAAWVLDPENLPEITKWTRGLSAPAEDKAKWGKRRDNTLSILRLMVRRSALLTQRRSWLSAKETRSTKRARSSELEDLSAEDLADGVLEDAAFVVDNVRLDADYDVAMTEVTDEFMDYYLGRGRFGPDAPYQMRTDQDWPVVDGRLMVFAIRALNMACTVSDIERLHKVYSLVHTPERSCLKDDRVDRLSMGRVVDKLDQCPKKPLFNTKAFEAFTTLSASQEEDLVSWFRLVDAAITGTAATIVGGNIAICPQPLEDAEEAGVVSVEPDALPDVGVEAVVEPNDSTGGPQLPTNLARLGRHLGMYGQHM